MKGDILVAFVVLATRLSYASSIQIEHNVDKTNVFSEITLHEIIGKRDTSSEADHSGNSDGSGAAIETKDVSDIFEDNSSKNPFKKISNKKGGHAFIYFLLLLATIAVVYILHYNWAKVKSWVSRCRNRSPKLQTVMKHGKPYKYKKIRTEEMDSINSYVF